MQKGGEANESTRFKRHDADSRRHEYRHQDPAIRCYAHLTEWGGN